MQMFLASCSQMRCHYAGSVSDLLFPALLLNWVTECGPYTKTHSNVQFVSIARCCRLQAWPVLVVTAEEATATDAEVYRAAWSEAFYCSGTRIPRRTLAG